MKLRKSFLLCIVIILTFGTLSVYANEVKSIEFSEGEVEIGDFELLVVELDEELKKDTYLSVSLKNKYSSQLLYNFITLDKRGEYNYGIIPADELNEGTYEVIQIDIVDEDDDIIKTLDTDKNLFYSSSFEVKEDENEDFNKVEAYSILSRRVKVGEKLDLEVHLENNRDADYDYEFEVMFRHISKNKYFSIPVERVSGYDFETKDGYKVPNIDLGIYNFFAIKQYKVFEYDGEEFLGLVYTYDEDEFEFGQIEVLEGYIKEDEDEEEESHSKTEILINNKVKSLDDIKTYENKYEIEAHFNNDEIEVSIPYNMFETISKQNDKSEFNIVADNFTYSIPVSSIYNNYDIKKSLDKVVNENIKIENANVKIEIRDYTKKEDYVKAFTSKFNKSILHSNLYNVELNLTYSNRILTELDELTESTTKTIKFNNTNNEQKSVYVLDENMDLHFVPHKINANSNEAVANSIGNGTFGVISIYVKYDDVNEGAWYEDAVLLSLGKGLTSGMDNKFYPQGQVTRAEFVTMIVNGIDLPSVDIFEYEKYDDINSNSWYYEKVMMAKKYGLLEEIATTNFEPAKFITREEMANIIGKVLNVKEIPVTSQYVDLTNVFTDGNDIDEKYLDEIQNVYKTMIIKGSTDGKFNPKGNCTRAEAVQIQINLLKFLGYL